ncbi:E3 ubiquitin-protein ligase RNF169 [Heteronotia binoei]|uniref:E3 ubiquitin-protein ligase RNF169 n=1 Tax=Heteronotia binoei TaxID=13085 RepID=UPI0029313908|nr:E3 ubiquitin-protein ligase RNF169 [Heteronotia binoei]
MAAAATASSAAVLGGRAAVSPLLRRGRGRRRRPRGGREEKRKRRRPARQAPSAAPALATSSPRRPGLPRERSLRRRRPQTEAPPCFLVREGKAYAPLRHAQREPRLNPAPGAKLQIRNSQTMFVKWIDGRRRDFAAWPDACGVTHERFVEKIPLAADRVNERSPGSCFLCFTSFPVVLFFSAGFIFRAPITLSRPAELHEEYRSQLRKLRDEKLQEERTPEDFIHKLILEDPEAGRRKADDQKKEESSAVKMTQEHLPERLSDSENEEPFQGKPGHHRSAFVSKGNSYSLALLSGTLYSRVERSQSCNDTLRERSKSRQRSAPVRTKINPPASVSTPIAGVLSSTQNNRCLSAPDLTAEKRAGLAAASLPALPKPERSISPESNDSISEELNHFKPIVCSPCTPPKRLPDGGVLSPFIIKSTPRNLTRSLQKPTTYEASPRILRKWEQIFQERQIKKTLSKATLTSSALDAGEDFLVPSLNALHVVKEPAQASNDFLIPGSLAHAQSDGFSSPRGRKFERASGIERDLAAGNGPKASNARSPNSASRLAGSGLGASAGAQEGTKVHAACPENGTPARAAAGKKRQRLKYLYESERPNGVCCGEEAFSLRQGRKRQCKTKHLEQSCAAKRPRQGGLGAAAKPLRRSRAERRRQEEEDRRLALQLQWAFDRENRKGARRRGRAEQYFLRSKSTLGAQ